ncbi:MAG: hypothetical protein CM15mP23_23080 [Cryomorphaceae bacterium]|nr:MAG: hypothetical protein CM15mP23_23080 [Cryomorphaceae bacterium]
MFLFPLPSFIGNHFMMEKETPIFPDFLGGQVGQTHQKIFPLLIFKGPKIVENIKI